MLCKWKNTHVFCDYLNFKNTGTYIFWLQARINKEKSYIFWLQARINKEKRYIYIPLPKKTLQFIAFINVSPVIIPNIKVQGKQIFGDIPPSPQKMLNSRLDDNTVLRIQFFFFWNFGWLLSLRYHQLINGRHFFLIPYKPLTCLPHFRTQQNRYISSLLVYSQRQATRTFCAMA